MTPIYRVWCVVTWCDVGRVMEMMEMLTGTSVIRMGIYRDHGAMQIHGGTRGNTPSYPDTL